jgi:hypothetical protein
LRGTSEKRKAAAAAVAGRVGFQPDRPLGPVEAGRQHLDAGVLREEFIQTRVGAHDASEGRVVGAGGGSLCGGRCGRERGETEQNNPEGGHNAGQESRMYHSVPFDTFVLLPSQMNRIVIFLAILPVAGP